MGISVGQLWEHAHDRAVDGFSLATGTGDVVYLDHRERVVYLNPAGKPVWDKAVSFSPVACRMTADGTAFFLLTYEGRLMKVGRSAELEWDQFVDREGRVLAGRSDGGAAVVASVKGRFHAMSGKGKRLKLVHTPEPVAFARFTPKGGMLCCASAQGWVGLYDRAFTPLGEYRLGRPVAEIEVARKGEKIFIPARSEGLHVIDPAAGTMDTLDPGFAVAQAGVDAAGERAALAGLEGDLALVTPAGDVLWKRRFPHSWVGCEMSADGNRFVALSGKGVLCCFGVGVRDGGGSGGGETTPPKRESPFAELEVADPDPPATGGSGGFDFIEI